MICTVNTAKFRMIDGAHEDAGRIKSRPFIYVDLILSVAVVVVSVADDDDDGYFGQEQVPLTDEIREILEEYPDGQIFKVCTDM